MSEFKIGDIVLTKENCVYNFYCEPEMFEGVVKDIFTDEVGSNINVEVLEGKDKGRTYWIDSRCFILKKFK